MSTTTSSNIRILVTGHAGLLKEQCLTNLCNYIYEQDATWKSLSHDTLNRLAREKQLAQWYEAENDLKPMIPFLATDYPEQVKRWYRSVLKAISKCNEENPKYGFLSIHLSYRWYSGFVSPVSWRIPVENENGEIGETNLFDILKNKFKPDYILTLIDDIQSVKKRISPGIYLRLNDIINWRNIEMIMSDLTAREAIDRKETKCTSFPFEYSPVIAIRHPANMVYNYLFSPKNTLRIYASFPISRTRFTPEYREEINTFRDKLLEHFCVFDPLTIDERPLGNLLEKFEKGVVNLKLSKEDRWSIPANRTLCGENVDDIENIPRNEIEEIISSQPKHKSIIDRSIELRDFRLIDQSDCVVVYRPLFKKGEYSGGTAAEIRYAQNRGKPYFIIHDPKDDGSVKPETFDIEIPDSDYFIDMVEDLSNPENQQKTLDIVIQKIKDKTNDLISERLR